MTFFLENEINKFVKQFFERLLFRIYQYDIFSGVTGVTAC